MSEYTDIYNALDDGVTNPGDIAQMRIWLLDAAQALADRDRFRAALEAIANNADNATAVQEIAAKALGRRAAESG